MKSCLSAIFAFVVIIALIILGNSYFVVNEGQKAIVTRFGAPMGDVREPGLNFKTPFIEDVIYFDTRILKWDGEPNQIPTKEKNYIWIDCTARWRIKDPLLYYKKLGNINSAQSKLDDIIDSVVRDCISSNYLVDIVRSDGAKDNINLDSETQNIQEIVNSQANNGNEQHKTREEILAEILEKSKPDVSNLGLELMDIQIKRILYTNEVLQKIYNSMIAEREKEAAKYLSEGKGIVEEKQGEIAKELSKIRSEASQKVNEIKGKADADAARIYAEAYSKDPEFYAFYRSLESLEKISNSRNSKLVISTDSDLYKYLKKAKKE